MTAVVVVVVGIVRRAVLIDPLFFVVDRFGLRGGCGAHIRKMSWLLWSKQG